MVNDEALDDVLNLIENQVPALHSQKIIRDLLKVYYLAESDFDSKAAYSVSYPEYFEDRRMYAISEAMKEFNRIRIYEEKKHAK